MWLGINIITFKRTHKCSVFPSKYCQVWLLIVADRHSLWTSWKHLCIYLLSFWLSMKCLLYNIRFIYWNPTFYWSVYYSLRVWGSTHFKRLTAPWGAKAWTCFHHSVTCSALSALFVPSFLLHGRVTGPAHDLPLATSMWHDLPLTTSCGKQEGALGPSFY